MNKKIQKKERDKEAEHFDKTKESKKKKKPKKSVNG